MKIGLYIVSSLLFIAIVIAGVYIINPNTFSFEVFGINLPKLPVAIWVAIPVATLAIASVLHMAFYSTRNFLNQRRWKNDIKKLEDLLYWALINEPTEASFSQKELEKATSLLCKSAIYPLNLESIDIPLKLKETAETIKKINKGEYIDLKKQKFAKHLSDTNLIVLKNNENHLEKEPTFALKVLDFKEKYDDKLVKRALDIVVETQDFYTVEKYAKNIGKDRFFKILKRVKVDKEIGFGFDILNSFIKEYDLDCKDYYIIASVTLESFTPDENLELFKKLSQENEKAMTGYLYLLFKYEMLDKVKGLLEELPEDEFKVFRAFFFLKKDKSNYKTSDIITVDNICK